MSETVTTDSRDQEEVNKLKKAKKKKGKKGKVHLWDLFLCTGIQISVA